MNADELRELLTRDPFEPFRLRLTSGDTYEIRDPQSVAVMKSRMFVAMPGGDHWLFVPFLHVAAIESIRNGHASRRRKRRSG
ncbi:MAG: hypothetical protein HZB38_10015 [Planctomycetes bacterium]|nr:hypothetical protein [Planctomycetota bacterium]